jgi:amidohydrolase
MPRRPRIAAGSEISYGPCMEQTLAGKLTAWRRHLHAHPELTLHEKETSAFVCARLTELGVPYVAGVGGHGVVATISRGQSNRSVGLRADMDALPITETTGLVHASTNPGVMHACGHDGHTTSLLGAAALLQGDATWTGTVHLVFQPAEEGGGGAKNMIADGLFERFPMERIFGYHNWPGLDAGAVAVHDSAVMASGNRIEFHVKGHSGHAALPHLTRDPMVASAQLLLALQTIVSRSVDPLDAAVVSIATMQAGTAANQIPGEAVMRGTMRTLRNETRDLVEQAIRRIAAGVAHTFDVEIDVTLRRGNPVTVNSPAERDVAAEAVTAAGLPLRRDVAPAMTGEDFAWYLQQRPGAFVWIGNGPAEDGRELHNSAYDYNDAILPAAATYLASVAKRALGE